MFDGFIVRIDCINGLKDLKGCPNVKNIVLLPRDWVLYEFHHPIFQDPDFLDERAWREKMEKDPAVRQSRIEMLNQERALLAPWYSKKKKLGDADGFIASEICHYRVCTLARMRWMIFTMPAGWGSATAFRIKMFAEKNPKDVAMLSELLQEWIDASKGEVKASSQPGQIPDGLILKANCSSSGHWLAVLWVLLSDARWKTGVTQMALTLGEL